MADIAMRLHIEADPDTVYAAISTTEGIHGWFTTTATAAQGVGGRHELSFPGVPEPWRLRVTEAEPGKRLVLAGENGPWTDTTQTYEVLTRPDGDVTLRFTHSGFPAVDEPIGTSPTAGRRSSPSSRPTPRRVNRRPSSPADPGRPPRLTLPTHPMTHLTERLMNTQHSTLHPAIRECAAAVAATATAVRGDQLGDRTPCEKFTVHELLDHLGTTLMSSARAARKEPQAGEGDALSMSPAAVAEAAELAASAWVDPAAYEGTTEFGPGEMPAAFAATITLEELALHGWDLARATGQTFSVGEETAEVALGVVEQIADQARANGSFGPPVPVAFDAPAFHRALGASGRNPEWSD
ncbi:TIGR03086 family metal-binding protein [Streptomyces sp. 11x1]|uniref:TIGR03086 family metal-binding protein n=1 Tax=Streptomyces sp. 11x1 TaxID=3038642 RepID=UPI002930C4B8|nr:TIGR03086 family metal-binding protein [Streptomyces sp. 11x1]WNZ11627.1 TIGR03086 family metal-binding protein [Streptomyces sp. 11x1]